jgi:hypothetical protein
MIPDDGVSDERWYFLDSAATRSLAFDSEDSSLDDGQAIVSPRTASVAASARMTHLAATLHQVRAELLRAHTATVVALGRLPTDRERLGKALAEARHQREGLYLVQRAAEAVEISVRLARRAERTAATEESRDVFQRLTWEKPVHL